VTRGGDCAGPARWRSDSLPGVSTHADPPQDDIAALAAALAAEREARLEAEARAAGAEAMVAHLKLI
jgi:hypothetical protein